jgi:hypothetical protein
MGDLMRLQLFSLFLSGTFLLSGPVLAAPADAKKSGKPEVKTEKIELPPLFLAEVKGEVYVVYDEVKEKADPPQVLVANDRILTRANSIAYLQFQDGGIVEVGPNSDLKVGMAKVQPGSFKARFLLAYGKTIAMVKKLTTASSLFEIEAGGVIAGVRGTIYGVEYDGFHCQVKERTYEGSVVNRWGTKKREKKVDQGEYGTICPREEPAGGKLSPADVADFIRFKKAAAGLEGKRTECIKKLRKKFESQVGEKARMKHLMTLMAIGGC